MTTMTNEQMATAVEVLSTLGETGKLGYAIARNIRKLKDAAKEYLDIKAKAFQDFGQAIPLKDGKSMTIVPKENMDDFQAALADLKDIEHEVDVYQIDADTFFSGSLKSNQMESLLWMVKDEESEDE